MKKHRTLHRISIGIAAVLASIALGFVCTYGTGTGFDDVYQHNHSLWLLGKFGLGPMVSFKFLGHFYAPLWDLILGIATEWVFPWLRDPIWVRHAFTFGLWPLTLGGAYLLLRRAGERQATALFASAMLFGIIRFGGHAFGNTKDFPAAAGFLLVTIGQWIVLKEWDGRDDQRAWVRFGWLGALCAVPFLLRVPLLHHIALLCALLLLSLVRLPRERRGTAAFALSFSLATAALTIFLFYPFLWEKGGDLLSPLSFFGKFDAQIVPVAIFGHPYGSDAIPWWYSLAWFPLVAHPAVLLLAIGGGVLAFFPRSGRAEGKATGLPFLPPLRAWLGIVTGLGFGLTLLLQPHLYDEERHLLFLFPPLFLFAALQYERLGDRLLRALAGIVAACAVVAYVWWGQWAYVYKPIFFWGIADGFSGDYRGLCLSRAIDALPGRASTELPVIVKGPVPDVASHYRRRRSSLLARDPAMGDYVLRDRYTTGSGFTMLWFNRFSRQAVYEPAVKQGKAKVLWSMNMPSGDPACSVVSFDKFQTVPRSP